MTAKLTTRLRDVVLAAAAFATVLGFVLFPWRPQSQDTIRSQTVQAIAPDTPGPRLAFRVDGEPDRPVR